MVNPYNVVADFEEAVADYAGSKYAVATESCTAAIFLSLMYQKKHRYTLPDYVTNYIYIPKLTYPGVACSIIHAGFKLRFVDEEWKGEYELQSRGIWDAALRFKRGMYHGGFQCLSFHIKKILPIGRGGMILTNNEDAYEWLKKARFDGRSPVPLLEDNFTMLGWNMYMQPGDAARGMQLLQVLGDRELADIDMKTQGYADLSKFKIYTQ